jgi:hypothetical protein
MDWNTLVGHCGLWICGVLMASKCGDMRFFIVVLSKGDIFYQKPKLGLGWQTIVESLEY